jgi:hypothetical protein
MSEAQELDPNNNREDMKKIIARATEQAKARNARLRHMKERNENYLAERREYDNEEEKTPELPQL